MTKQVKNLETGSIHDVPEGHWALTDNAYQVITSEPEPKEKTTVTKRKPRTKKED